MSECEFNDANRCIMHLPEDNNLRPVAWLCRLESDKLEAENAKLRAVVEAFEKTRDELNGEKIKAYADLDAALLQKDEADGRYDRAFDAAQKYRAALEQIVRLRGSLMAIEDTAAIREIVSVAQAALADKPKQECPACGLVDIGCGHVKATEKRKEGS